VNANQFVESGNSPPTVRLITLTQGYFAQVDAADYEWLMAGPKWYADVHRRKDGSILAIYAARNIRKDDGAHGRQSMHRFILGVTDPKIEVDHHNGNGLDNKRENLRVATSQQNKCNQRMSTKNISGYKGVGWSTLCKSWEARIQNDGKGIHLGYFDNILDAKEAADAGRLRYHGEFAMTNSMIADLPTVKVNDHPPVGRPYGERHGGAKLTEEQAMDILTRYSAGGILQKTLAREYGVDDSTISLIVRGHNWAHLSVAAKLSEGTR
jgi:hypothetical protein